MPRQKIILDQASQPDEKIEWDKKKIIITSVILLGLVIGGFMVKQFLLGSRNPSSGSNDRQSVKGINYPPSQNGSSSQNSSNFNSASNQLPSFKSIGQGVQQEIKTLEKQAQSVSLQEVASSSPQVQQIIQQLQQLPSLPQSIAKQTCEQICGKL